MEKINREELLLIGLQLNQKTSNRGGLSGKDYGDLWQKFELENYAEKITQKLSDEIYAVYHDYDTDDTDTFAYFIGCRVNANETIPEGMSQLIIPATTCYRVTAKGKMTACVTEAWQSIKDAELSRTYQYDYEVYDERSKDWSDAELDIYVSCRM